GCKWNSCSAHMGRTNSEIKINFPILNLMNLFNQRTIKAPAGRFPAIGCALLVLGLSAEAKLNVVATTPDFAAIAQEIGGDKIEVTSIARGTEDPHFVDARPSYIRVLNQADMLLEGGAELEIGWLPPLVNGARNDKILGES